MELTEMTSVERASAASTSPEFDIATWGHCIQYLHHPDRVPQCPSPKARSSTQGYHLVTIMVHQETLITNINYGH